MRCLKMNNKIDILNLTKKYQSGDGLTTALSDITLSIKENSFCCIVGQSGSGKTTLLNMIAGLDNFDQGQIFLDKRDISHFSASHWDTLRNQEIGFIFQNYMLLQEFTALENIMLPHYIRTSQKKEAKKEALKLLESLGMKEKANLFPLQLSGGEAQRVAICRAIINKPSLILADEPTGNLDKENQTLVMQKLLELKKEKEFTLIVVTHSQDIAKLADEVFTLHFGSLKK
jgi:ABC-type lipoprotein export system ATPase subunit